MPSWLKSLLDLANAALDRFGDASERFMALMCLALVVPLTLVADVALIIWGMDGRDRLHSLFDYDAWIGTYLGVTALLAAVLALVSEWRGGGKLAALLDRAMLPIAYLASALMVLFAALMWATGSWVPGQ